MKQRENSAAGMVVGMAAGAALGAAVAMMATQSKRQMRRNGGGKRVPGAMPVARGNARG